MQTMFAVSLGLIQGVIVRTIFSPQNCPRTSFRGRVDGDWRPLRAVRRSWEQIHKAGTNKSSFIRIVAAAVPGRRAGRGMQLSSAEAVRVYETAELRGSGRGASSRLAALVSQTLGSTREVAPPWSRVAGTVPTAQGWRV